MGSVYKTRADLEKELEKLTDELTGVSGALADANKALEERRPAKADHSACEKEKASLHALIDAGEHEATPRRLPLPPCTKEHDCRDI